MEKIIETKKMTTNDIKWPELSKGKCCHTVLSMLTGKPIEEIIELSKTIGFGGDRLSGPCIQIACRKLGIKIEEWKIYQGWVRMGNPFPPDCLILTWVSNDIDIEVTSHIILRIGNIYYDPCNYGKELYHFPAHQIPTHFAEIETNSEWYESEDKSHQKLQTVWAVNS